MMLQPVMDRGVFVVKSHDNWEHGETGVPLFSHLYNLILLDSVMVWKQLHLIFILLFNLTAHFNTEATVEYFISTAGLGTTIYCTQWNH